VVPNGAFQSLWAVAPNALLTQIFLLNVKIEVKGIIITKAAAASGFFIPFNYLTPPQRCKGEEFIRIAPDMGLGIMLPTARRGAPGRSLPTRGDLRKRNTTRSYRSKQRCGKRDAKQ
jgi:hypothetical protein